MPIGIQSAGVDAGEHLELVGGARVFHDLLEQEAVHLRLGQLVGASCSIGFCVAITRNGRGTLWISPPIVVCRSCIASSIADWVLALERLISSSSTKFACTGPSTVRKDPLAAS